mgnify:CR=1 FL=1
MSQIEYNLSQRQPLKRTSRLLDKAYIEHEGRLNAIVNSVIHPGDENTPELRNELSNALSAEFIRQPDTSLTRRTIRQMREDVEACLSSTVFGDIHVVQPVQLDRIQYVEFTGAIRGEESRDLVVSGVDTVLKEEVSTQPTSTSNGKTIGLEMTYFPPTEVETSYKKLSKLFSPELVNKARTGYGWKKPYEALLCHVLHNLVRGCVGDDKDNCHIDGYVIEISTRVFKSISEVGEFYVDTDRYMKAIGLVPWFRSEYGGSCHINLGHSLGNDDRTWARFAKLLHIDLCNRPYLSWIFNSPGDKSNANSFLYSEYEDHEWIMNRFKSRSDLNSCSALQQNKDCYYNHRHCYHGTSTSELCIEYRFFEMCKDWSELKHCLDFIIKYQDHFEKLALSNKNAKIRLRFNKEISSAKYFRRHFPTPQSCIVEFKALLKTLGLDYKNYRFLVNRNLKLRYEFYPDTLV